MPNNKVGTRILGIDPGYERLGIAVLERIPSGERVNFSTCFQTSPELEFPERLRLIAEKISSVIDRFEPEVLAIETLFLNTNHKTAMRVAEVRGVVINEGKKDGLRILEVSPGQVKLATTGDGRADKKQMMKMVRMLLKLGSGKESDDELDAIAIALAALSFSKNIGVIHN